MIYWLLAIIPRHNLGGNKRFINVPIFISRVSPFKCILYRAVMKHISSRKTNVSLQMLNSFCAPSIPDSTFQNIMDSGIGRIKIKPVRRLNMHLNVDVIIVANFQTQFLYDVNPESTSNVVPAVLMARGSP